ncbi:MAG: histidine phosphatase family protein [Treponema sp.]|nr:histidine phosphatase family protein [Treponema sp.]
MNIYFIRHGEPDYDTDSLTENGHKQAAILAERVKDFPIDEFFHSPMGRARQTAEYCNKYFGYKMTELPWIKEIEWGDLSGDAYSSDGPWCIAEDMIKNEHAYPKGDDWKKEPRLLEDRLVGDIENRIKAFDSFLSGYGYEREGQLYRITKENKSSIAFFCHGGLTSALVSHLLNIPFWSFIVHFPMEMTGITKLCISGKPGTYAAAEADFINSYTHLGTSMLNG